MAQALGGITEDGVKFNIGLLQQYGALKRKGGRKNGEWVVNPAYLPGIDPILYNITNEDK